MECLRDLFPARGAGRRRTSDWLDRIVRDAPRQADILEHMEERLRVTRERRARARAAEQERMGTTRGGARRVKTGRQRKAKKKKGARSRRRTMW